MNDVVQVARSCPFQERSGLLGEQLFERVGEDVCGIGKPIGVGMKDRSARRGCNNCLVLRDVEQETWPRA
jgi:hypothetical protein